MGDRSKRPEYARPNPKNRIFAVNNPFIYSLVLPSMSLISPIKILGISGSLRMGSTNAVILQAFASLAPEDVEFTIYEHLGDLPHFSPERDTENVAESVTHLRALLAEADGVVLCTPEYAFGVPGVLKNSLDWMVSSAQYNEKPVAAISASPLPSGGDKAMASLLLTLQALGTRVPMGGVLSIPAVYQKLSNGTVSDPKTIEALSDVLHALLGMIRAGSVAR